MGATTQDKDAALVVLACAGDRSAFDALVMRHRSYVFSLAYRLCGDREAAEDICVEAFCEAYRALPRFRPDPHAKFLTWLHRVATNVCLEHLRQQRTRQRYLPEAPIPEEAPSAADVCEQALNNTSAAEVQRAIQTLPEPQMLAVRLFYLEGHSCAEIAAQLHVPRNTVKTRLFYGTRALREILAAQPRAATPARGGTHADL